MLEKLKEWLGLTPQKEEKQPEKEPEKEAFCETRKISKQGGSFYVNLPKEWFKKNDIDPEEVEEITMLANSDILIINPGRANEVKKKMGKKAFEIYKEEKET